MQVLVYLAQLILLQFKELPQIASVIKLVDVKILLNEETACGEPDLDVSESYELTDVPRHLSHIRRDTNLQGCKELFQRASYEILLLQQ